MGIFSFFSRDDKDDEKPLQETDQQSQQDPFQPETAPTEDVYEGMQLDVTTKEGEPLLSGRVTEFSSDTLTLGRLPGELSFKVTPAETAVSLIGYDKRLMPICLSGVVEESGRTILRLKNLKIEHLAEHRDNFRLPFTAPVSLYRLSDERLRNPEECTLVNISTGGCCVQSEYVHVEDEVLRIRVKLEDYAPLSFLGQVVRCVEHTPGQYRYGILFAQQTEQEITALNKTLYNLQMGIKKTHVRSESGHW
ncbi:MAG: PilZ domain-containing protein [Oscillibacter sp.]|nr:PilZ domain-containing protein [Oscillibacter sp.]